MTKTFDVAIVGGGIVGLAHAWSAAERGHRVVLFERSKRACGSSVRNFGMVWPIGQPAGELHQVALESRDRWLQVGKAAGIWVNECGSIHLAHRDDEQAVLQEFQERSQSLGFESTWLVAEEVQRQSSAANPDGLLGGLHSPTELCVDPRATIARLPHWLTENYGVQCQYGTTITRVDAGCLQSADGQRWEAVRIIVCSGADFATLFPEQLRESNMRLCKLQMLKTTTQANNWKLGPHLASGLTLRHYRNFEVCRSLAPLKQRIAAESPELDKFGIHVMASQNEAGEVILGDSHEYDTEIEPFNKSKIDDLILNELQKVICLPDWTILERWSGIYAKHPTDAWFESEPMPNIHICTGLGGAGMTMSFGIAERFWQRVSS